MPTYDYRCNACGREFEHMQSIKDALLSVCPHCKKRGKLERLIGMGAGIIFKGKGFYQTDYKNVAPRKTSKDSGDKASGAKAPSSSASNSKASPSKKEE